MIREIRPEDIIRIREIHEKFYRNEFSFPDFYRFFCAFVVTNDSDEVITIGGLKLITEAIIVTNKDASVRDRKKALIELMQATKFICDRTGYPQMHAFVQDPIWKRQLIKHGFRICKGDALVTDVS